MKARSYVIGDIHGCCKTFKCLLLEKIVIKKTDKIYCVGDYIDRGPDSKGVIDFILQLRRNGYHIHTLRGNHEQLLLDSQKDEQSFLHWAKNGGDKTLKSFKIDNIKKLKPAYLNFFKRTKYYIQTNNFILAHAGLNFSLDEPLEDKYSMLWIRNFTVDTTYLKERILIHGHTPIRKEDIKMQKFESPINLDGGCVFKSMEGFGSLFALNFYERKLIEVENID